MGDPNGQASYPTITDVGSGGNNGTMTNMIAAPILKQMYQHKNIKL